MTGALRIQVWKEFRALLPWWAGVIFSVAVFGYLSQFRAFGHGFDRGTLMAAIFISATGSAALGALSVGHEFTHRTIGGLLTYPVERRRLISIKLALLFAFLIIAVGVATVAIGPQLDRGSRNDAPTFIYAPAIAALFLAPWLTILTRGPLAGTVFAVSIPTLLLTFALPFGLSTADGWRIFLGLAALGGVMTWVSFMRLSVSDGRTQVAGMTALFDRPMPAERAHAATAAGTGVFWQLLRKELRLQQMTFAVSGLYVVGWFLTLLPLRASSTIGQTHEAMTFLYGGIVSLLAGSVASAEERQFGTAEWQLLLPLAAWKQWVFKVLVAIATALALSIALPLILQVIHQSPTAIAFDEELIWFAVTFVIAGLFSSSMSSTGLRAMLASFPLVAATVIAGTLISPAGEWAYRSAVRLATSTVSPGTFSPAAPMEVMRWIAAMGIVGGWMLVLAFGFANHRTADRSRARLIRQFLWMLIIAVLALVVVGALNGILWTGVRRPGY